MLLRTSVIHGRKYWCYQRLRSWSTSCGWLWMAHALNRRTGKRTRSGGWRHDWNLKGWEVALCRWATECFLVMKLVYDDAVNMVDDNEFRILCALSAIWGLTVILRGSALGRVLPDSIRCHREVFHWKKNQLWQPSPLSLRGCCLHLSFQQPLPWSTSDHPHPGGTHYLATEN